MAKLVRIETEKLVFVVNFANVTHMASYLSKPDQTAIHFVGKEASIIVNENIANLTTMAERIG